MTLHHLKVVPFGPPPVRNLPATEANSRSRGCASIRVKTRPINFRMKQVAGQMRRRKPTAMPAPTTKPLSPAATMRIVALLFASSIYSPVRIPA